MTTGRLWQPAQQVAPGCVAFSALGGFLGPMIREVAVSRCALVSSEPEQASPNAWSGAYAEPPPVLRRDGGGCCGHRRIGVLEWSWPYVFAVDRRRSC